MVFLTHARKALSQFLLRKADSLTRQYGFGYVDKEHAPSSFPELVEEWSHSVKTGLAFPVWSGCSDNTIYTSKGANYAFRFWHDSIHATRRLGFDTDDELAIGAEQMKVIQAEFGMYSLEALIMYADTIGQTTHAALNDGQFPENQEEFVIHLVTSMAATLAKESHVLKAA